MKCRDEEMFTMVGVKREYKKAETGSKGLKKMWIPVKIMVIKEHRKREEEQLQEGKDELESKELDREQHNRRSSAGYSQVNERVEIVDCLHYHLAY